MTDLELVVACAEKVMQRDAKTVCRIAISFNAGDREGWNPLASDDDGFQIVDEILKDDPHKRFVLEINTLTVDGGWHAGFTNDTHWIASWVCQDRRRAIVRACLKAVGVNTE